MKTLFVSLSLSLLVSLSGIAFAQKTCQRVTNTSQNCLATVSWTASVVDATHDAPANYVIRRNASGGAMAQIGTVVATTTTFQNTFTDTGGVNYCYEVVATKSAQSSPPSTQVCWTTPAIAGAAPNAPQGVSIATLNSSNLRITWDDNNDSETGYEIWGKQSKGNQQYDKLIALAADVTTWDWPGRRRYTSYCVEVMATGNPNSPFSNPVCATTSK
jgi:hypothetical protein